MKKSTKNQINIALFYGGLWGILEATIGYVLHWLPTLISGAIMFPIGVALMAMAYKESGSRQVVLNMAVVAAAIKLVNLFMPNLSVMKVINPSISILIEGAVVLVGISALVGSNKGRLVAAAIGTSLAWRSIFVTYMVGQSFVSGKVASYTASLPAALEFVIVTGLISAAMVAVVAYFISIKETHIAKRTPLASVASCAIALVLTLLL